MHIFFWDRAYIFLRQGTYFFETGHIFFWDRAYIFLRQGIYFFETGHIFFGDRAYILPYHMVIFLWHRALWDVLLCGLSSYIFLKQTIYFFDTDHIFFWYRAYIFLTHVLKTTRPLEFANHVIYFKNTCSIFFDKRWKKHISISFRPYFFLNQMI